MHVYYPYGYKHTEHLKERKKKQIMSQHIQYAYPIWTVSSESNIRQILCKSFNRQCTLVKHALNPWEYIDELLARYQSILWQFCSICL
jgi:hypothetical protein